MTDRDLDLVAYHEAGHTVVAWLQGLPIDLVHVVPVGEFEGQIIQPRSWQKYEAIEGDGWYVTPERARADPAAAARVSVAGYWAELRRSGVEDRQGASFDFENYERHLARLVPEGRPFWDDERRAYDVLLSIQARRMVEEHWHLVEALAAELTGRRALVGDEAAEILRRAKYGDAADREPDY